MHPGATAEPSCSFARCLAEGLILHISGGFMYILDLGLKPSIVRKWFRHSLVSTKMPPHAGFKAILAATGIPSKRLRASARILARILPPRILARVLARILARDLALDLARVLGVFGKQHCQ